MIAKVLIIDDESAVIRGIRAMIDWKALGLELVGVAQDGESGLRLIRTLRPDLVITDIRMPGIYGLEMIRKANEINPGIQYIILSGYSEFQYAKEAIAIGVYAFLEKPVSVEELTKTLGNAKAARMKNLRIKDKYEQYRQESLKLLLREASNRTVFLTEDGLKESVDLFSVQAIHFAVCRFLTKEQLSPSCLSVSQEKLSKCFASGFQFLQLPDQGRLTILLLAHKETTPKATLVKLEKYRAAMESAGYPVRIGLGFGSEGSLSISAPYQEALHSLQQADFQDAKGIFYQKEHDAKGMVAVENEKRALLECVEKRDASGVGPAVTALFHTLENQAISVERMHHECLSLVYAVIEAVESTKRSELSDWLFTQEAPHVVLPQKTTLMQLQQYMAQFFQNTIDHLSNGQLSSVNNLVAKAMHYIDAHYNENLTLQKISEVVGFNASYFCVLFRENAGISFSKYLLNVRMRHAKALLRSGEKVTIVSEKVGYCSYRHFCKVFKQATGVTPKEYRDFPNNTDNI